MKMVFIFPDRKYKSIWRMPRLKKAMKDVAWRRYVSGRCLATFDPEISEWGNPSEYTSETLALDVREHTKGSKTFQYLEEKRKIFIF